MAKFARVIIEILDRIRKAAETGMVAGDLALGSVDQVVALCLKNKVSLESIGTSETELRELYRRGMRSEALKVIEEMRSEEILVMNNFVSNRECLMALLPDAKCSLEDLGTDEQEIQKMVEKYWASMSIRPKNKFCAWLETWFRSLFRPKREKRIYDYGAYVIENYKMVSFGKVGPTWPTEDEIFKPESEWVKRWAYRDGKTYQQKINEMTSGMK